jgi:acyl-CoA thioester hydrolase
MRTHTTEIRVRYAETDRMGVAHHSSYLLWFEVGRTGLMREGGRSYRAMEESGLKLPVIECQVKFFAGAEYDDLLRIEAAVAELKSRVAVFAYRVTRGSTLLASGWTKHACVDAGNRLRRIPPDVVEAIAPFRIPEGRTFLPG